MYTAAPFPPHPHVTNRAWRNAIRPARNRGTGSPAARSPTSLPRGSPRPSTGTTTGRMPSEPPTQNDFTAVTTLSRSRARLASMNSISLILLGGRVRGVTQAVVGEDALRLLSTLRVDVAFIGTNAISVGHGLSTPDSEEAAVKRAMVKAANHVVVVADSTKSAANTDQLRPARQHRRPHHRRRDQSSDTSNLHDHGIEVVIA